MSLRREELTAINGERGIIIPSKARMRAEVPRVPPSRADARAKLDREERSRESLSLESRGDDVVARPSTNDLG